MTEETNNHESNGIVDRRQSGGVNNFDPSEADEKVREILVLPNDKHFTIHETANEQIRSFTQFVEAKLAEYKEVVSTNSPAVFAVNYIQNRFISSDFCLEIAKLFELLEAKTRAEFNRALENMKTDIESEPLVVQLEDLLKQWNEFIESIDKELDAKLGPISTKSDDDEEIPELGVQSKTISYYVRNSGYDMILVVVVQSFTSAEANDHILSLYNKINIFHELGCDVFLLTKGPPIGSRGGSYIKLVGIPFKKLYDEEEAVKELKAHRRSATKLASWNALFKSVELNMGEETRPPSKDKDRRASNLSEDTMYIGQKAGTILVDRKGNILYKFIEECNNSWPKVDEIIDEVKKAPSSSSGKSTNGNGPNISKVNSEVSADGGDNEKEKQCCVIL
ncbi:hypothetical protein WR25_00403 [Diploscapter pachys]|uniref:Uncharacterized protein n=1 Tax=Diploscapter pachys TaxID=2018661 RepID=A0A2A2KPS2_9BILA|nr:hypothetical protein WR25_00403 [Diploscapter pachys]